TAGARSADTAGSAAPGPGRCRRRPACRSPPSAGGWRATTRSRRWSPYTCAAGRARRGAARGPGKPTRRPRRRPTARVPAPRRASAAECTTLVRGAVSRRSRSRPDMKKTHLAFVVAVILAAVGYYIWQRTATDGRVVVDLAAAFAQVPLEDRRTNL